ncbi:PEP-CTERM sorting domain-containing protein [Algisphaera agarilytica]|uniref:Ice-binding protein C-terminal domain-containing protein n=1 Tax=Algisphaera agarilytica TaxID=1385975 RepID=A0A7X0H9A0_9BACT|nr:PEP-CTERM sorting domain-containing protein [Algisphaera agarilytica]MBB6430134.1 hypothetical protein [Algisphaera agarilytica]
MMYLFERLSGARPIAAGLLATVLVGTSASGLIVQPSGSTLPADIPLDAVGTWGNNAAAIAVASGWVLTTRHQDSTTNPPDRTVVIDGMSYTADVDNQILFDSGGTTVDLRLVPLVDGSGNPAELTSFVEVYDGNISALGSTVTAITGFGPTIGATDTDGFDWAGTLDNGNALNAGQNRINGFDTIDTGTFSGMSVLVADFDEAGTPGLNGAVEFESTVSIGDSGGGWFINDGGTWKLTGLTHAVALDGDDDQNAGTTNDDFDAQAFFGQTLFAVDLRDYATTINAIPEPTSLALLGAGGLLAMTRRRKQS